MKAGKYRVKVNKAGLFFVGITIFLGVAAVNTANNLLYLVVSSMLAFMLLSGFLSLYNLKGIEVLLLPPQEVYAGSSSLFTAIVKNKKRMPSFLIRLTIDKEQCLFPLVHKEHACTIPARFEKRGFYKSINLKISSSFPVGLFERYYETETEIDLIVFPQPVEAKRHELMKLGVEKGTHVAHGRKGFDEFYGIREYAGDPIKLIHWKVSAKTGTIYVRELKEESSTPVIINLEELEGSLEERISKACYLIIKLTQEGRPVGLRLKDKIIEPSTGEAHKRQLLSELALL